MQFLTLVAKCALALLCLLTVAVAQEDDNDSKTVFDIISDTPELSEFAQLVGSDTDAGKALRNPEESVTVFVPTDTAVKGTSNEWDPLYHIASRRVLFAKGPALELVATQLASPFSFDVIGVRRERGKNSVLYSNQNANVERADIIASNGVVHVIDKVLLSPLMLEETCDALGIAKFEASLRKIKLEGMVYWQPNRTTFVPTDDAMSKLPDDLDDESLRRILRHHSVPAGATPIPTGFDSTLELVSDNDFELQVVANDTGTFVNGARVSIANYIVREGIMHVIDSVIATGPVSNAKSGDGDGANGGASGNNAEKETDAENSSAGNTSSDSGGNSGGKLSPIVTAVITAVVAGVLGIVGKLGVVLYRRRKQKSNSDDDTSSSTTDSPAPLISDKASGSYKALDEYQSRPSSDSSSALDGARAELGVSATSNSQSAQPAADVPRIGGTGQPVVPSSTGQPMSSS